jgi:hypothetical protein
VAAVQVWAGPQVVVQAPQWPWSVARSAQRPGPLPQVFWPGGQRQRALAQVAPVGQWVAQAPQLAASVWRSTQAPGAVPQVAGAVGGHWQTPAVQLAPAGQLVVQLPQWWMSVWRFTHAPGAVPQTLGAVVGHWQVPATQLAPAGQAVRQAPQLAGSFWVSTHWIPAPVQWVAMTSQAQAPAPQVPSPQDLSHAPQWAVSAWRSTQAPLQVSGAAAGHWQAPVTQLAPVGQAWRQAPQENGLACRSKQTPPQAVWPAGQVTGFAGQPARRAAAMAAMSRDSARGGEGMDRA